jgi:hypothetical protein
MKFNGVPSYSTPWISEGYGPYYASALDETLGQVSFGYHRNDSYTYNSVIYFIIYTDLNYWDNNNISPEESIG